MNALCPATASQIALAIRERRVTAVDVLAAHLERIARINPRVNAVVTLDAERAHQRAREADAALARGELWGPLHGVPVTFKDSFETAGVRTVCGADFLADYVPTQDATVVMQCLGAGAILLGKTNVPPMLDGSDTDNPVFGATRNPWNLAHTPGMSSGGSGAAVAAGLTPLDIASDMSGSIRLPAHFCGTFGLKPTQHRISRAGHIPPMRTARYVGNPLAAIGPMARSVADLALAFGVLAGAADPDYPETLPMPVGGSANGGGALRVGWCDGFGDLPVSGETREALGRFAEEMAAGGVEVRRCSPPGFDFHKAWRATGTIFGFTIAASMPEDVRAGWAEHLAATPADAANPMLAGLLDGARLEMAAYLTAMADRMTLMRELNAFLSDENGLDAWLCPAACGPAPASARAGQPVDIDGQSVPYGMALFGHVSIFNLTGHPAVSLPVAKSAGGLPIGFQLVGKPWREMELLAAAGRLCPDPAPLPDLD